MNNLGKALLTPILLMVVASGCGSVAGSASEPAGPGAATAPAADPAVDPAGLDPNLEPLGRWDWGPTFASIGLGDYAYFGSGGRIRILRMDEGAEWQEVGSLSTGGIVKDLAVSDNLLLVADTSGFLRIFDASKPEAPTPIGHLELPEQPQSVFARGRHAYVGSGYSGVRIIDISEPTKPEPVGRLEAPGITRGVHVSGNLGLVAAQELTLFDISDPTNPRELGRHAIPGSLFAVAAAGDHAYVTGIEAREGDSIGLRIVDISDPTAPEEAGFLRMEYGGEGIWVRGSQVYVAGVSLSAGLWVADVSDPTAPRWLGAYTHPTCSEGVSLIGSHAFLSHGDQGLEIFELSKVPTSGSEFARLPVVRHYDSAGRARGVSAVGDRVYLANGYTGLRILDTSDPSAPREIGHAPTYRALDVVIVGSHAFVADDNEGVRIVDVSDPSRPTTSAKRRFGDDFMSVDVAAGAAYFAASDLGLMVVDTTSTDAVTVLSRLDTPGTALGVRVTETAGDAAGGSEAMTRLAYVADWKAGLRIIDASDPLALREVGSYQSETCFAKDVDVSEHRAFLACRQGLLVLDVSNPASVSVLGFSNALRDGRSIEVSGSRAVVGDSAGVHVFDVSDPTAPTLVASRKTLAQVGGISLDNGRVLVAAYEAGLLVFGQRADALTPSGPDTAAAPLSRSTHSDY